MPQYGPFHITFAVMGALLGLVFVVVSMSSQTWPTLARVLAILMFVATFTNLGFLSFKGFFPAPISMIRDGVYEVASSVQSGGKTYSLLLPITHSFPTPGTTAPSVEKSDENTQNPATWSSYFKSRLSYLKGQLLRAASWFGYYVYPGPGLKPTTPVYCCTDLPLPAGAKYVIVKSDGENGSTTINKFVDTEGSK